MLWAECSVILMFPITLQGCLQSTSRTGPLMSGPSQPPPWGDTSLLRIKGCIQPEMVPRPFPDVFPGFTPAGTTGSWRGRRDYHSLNKLKVPMMEPRKGCSDPKRARGCSRSQGELVEHQAIRMTLSQQCLLLFICQFPCLSSWNSWC